jgi:two-component system chemotaxis response regulator CheB
VKLVSRIKVITHLRGKERPNARNLAAPAPRTRGERRLVAIGASTGGPGAVVGILRGLPPRFPLPLLLVIHVGAAFAAAMAEWLDGLSPLRVALARDGEPLPPVGEGRVILAPPDHHLLVQNGVLRLSREPERHSCRPSVDALFESVASEAGAAAVACLLTGMGRDGAQGLLAIRRAGGLTIAQDEATSVVFGMPREAIQLGAAEQILPVDRIAAALMEAAEKR